VLFDHIKYEKGRLYWTTRQRGRNHDKPIGSLKGNKDIRVYLTFVFNGDLYWVHRVIWEMHNMDIPEGYEIDHIDGDSLNNDISNLRLATREQNMCNRAVKKDSLTGVKGVNYSKKDKKFIASIKHNKTYFYLGRFDSLEEAKVAREKAEKNFQKAFRYGV